jgi:hypothetical protein
MASKSAPSRRKTTAIKDKFKWGEALVSGLVGYFAKPALISSGLPRLLVNASPTYAGIVNKGYAEDPDDNGPWAASGAGFLTKTTGLALAGKTAYDMTKRAPTERDISIKLPMALGLIADPNETGEGSGLGGGSSSGRDWV